MNPADNDAEAVFGTDAQATECGFDLNDDDHHTTPDNDDALSTAGGSSPNRTVRRTALVGGLSTVLALAALTGSLGFRAYQSHQDTEQHALLLQAGRQAALNLTTIDWEHVETDVQRVLDSATGTFYDDFSKRAQPFIDVVKQAKSKSTGTITEAGVESASGSEAQILLAVRVTASNAGAAEQTPHMWRMRISVQTSGSGAKVSNVEFVP